MKNRVIIVKRGGARRVSEVPENALVPSITHSRGLGDFVAAFANPVARSLGIDKAKCGCDKRQRWLNDAISFKRLRGLWGAFPFNRNP